MTEQNATANHKENDLVFSYLTLRNLIGFSGMALPFVLMFFTVKSEQDRLVEPSISDYYYTSNGDMLVVLLSVLGVFLFTYNGYNWKEKVLTNLAAICGMGVAFSPTATQMANSATIHLAKSEVPLWFGIERHFVFAGTFFIALAIMALVYFPKTHPNGEDSRTHAKIIRNRIYYFSGGMILLCVVLLGVYFKTQPAALDGVPVVFILETVAIEFFGLSWITKGETLYPDGKHYLKQGLDELNEALKKKPTKP
jgi:hypothetical protein